MLVLTDVHCCDYSLEFPCKTWMLSEGMHKASSYDTLTLSRSIINTAVLANTPHTARTGCNSAATARCVLQECM